jgi:hypothetical protein
MMGMSQNMSKKEIVRHPQNLEAVGISQQEISILTSK